MDNIYVNRMTDMTDNMTIQYDNMTVTICHDKESWWYTSQCNLSTKRINYFYTN